MNAKEIREKSENQLQVLIKESKEKLKDLRFSLANRQLKDYSEIKKTKKDVARAKAILKEKKIISDNNEK
ncbi:MAG: 50S ribosomal protein L29 [Candidatus Pacebacteria bacterium]|nr:50S ribosomal protein L29 [Candidatus Paceibacterota bacterium]